jgi:hypothetical protein
MKVHEVNFEFGMRGNEIVNFDSGDQKFLWNKESKNGNKNKFSSIDNNNSYAKKTYFRNNNGELDYKIKISTESLKYGIFNEDSIAINPSIQHHKSLLNQFIGSTLGLTRGYMFASNKETLTRTSPLMMTPAYQTNNAESYMEFHSRSGFKKTKTEGDTAKDTTIFNKESIGEITYFSEGSFDIKGLEFISADPIFGRCEFNPDDFEILKFFLSRSLPNFDSELGYYKLKSSVIDVAEFGFKLNSENIVFLIKETLKRIFKLNIRRAGAYAKVETLKVQLVSNIKNPKENIWIEINSEEDIDNLSFEVEEYYILNDESESKKQRQIIEEALKDIIDKKVADKKIKKDSKNKEDN